MKFAPGATLGILGGGQLGQMIGLEVRRMGYRVAILDPEPECPARAWSDAYIAGRWDDGDAAVRLAEQSDVVTLETEHIPAPVLDRVAKVRPVLPKPDVLRHIQDRAAQRAFLARHGLPQPANQPIDDLAGLQRALQEVGTPALLKTRRGGYDGRGQVRIDRAADAADALARLQGAPAVLEAFIPFQKEVSALLVRSAEGDVRHYPVAENVHRRGILHTTVVPARVDPEVAQRAQALAEKIAHNLGHVGTLAVEYFLLPNGELLVNEVAPRVHNTGHYTLGASSASQFEQHARAVLGLPLREADLLRPAAMLNLLGDLWAEGAPDWGPVLAEPRARLHLYGKKRASPGRKMGHVLVFGPTPEQALATAEALHARLAAPGARTAVT